jgi:predicted small lipoprotein YifL
MPIIAMASLQRSVVMQNPVKSIVLILMSLFALTACGQKGPLFLPGDPSEIRSISQESQPVAEGDEEDDDDIPRR